MKKILLVLLVLLTTGCDNVKTSEKSFFAMDTYMTVKIYSEKNADLALKEVVELFEYYNKLFDRFSESDITSVYTINTSNASLTVDQDLIDLLLFANRMNIESNGLLDINMGRVIDIWKQAAIAGEVPDILKLNEAYDSKKEYNISGSKIITNGAFIDVGSIAKGYAIKKASELLVEKGYDKYLINAGGQVHVGKRYRDDKYKIGIKNPDANENFLTINAENVGVSTSGGYERKFEVNGVVYNHIISPKTLFPANFMKSVSVVSSDPLLADALTTILFLMPIEEGLEFIKKYDAEAIFYSNDSKVIKTEGFSKYE